MNVTTKERAVKTSAWFLYTLIVLEILFMVSPFAAYYYSIYATPLKVLQEFPSAAWLTMYLLPHFTYSDSWLANGLLLISWPLILLGAVLFVLGFCQIYWAKFTGKGAVAVGLYRYIRHPQYVALAVVGLGSALYWSRFIVVIAYVSMLCLYYFLARVEERICLQKFGDSYSGYLDRTGMFLPRSWEVKWCALEWPLPDSTWLRSAIFIGIYIVVIGLTISMSHLLRNHVIDSIQTDIAETQVTVFLAPLARENRGIVADMIDGASLPGDIAYVVPSSWQVPELGFKGTTPERHGGSTSELSHPGTHGNSMFFDQNRLSVVLVEAAYVTREIDGIERFTQALDLRPMTYAVIDLNVGQIVDTRSAKQSQWAGIPVPTF